MIAIGEMVPFQPGLFTVKAMVIGMGKDKTQYILLLTFDRQDKTGNWVQMRRYYYRDRGLIEGLTRDAKELEQAFRLLRDQDHNRDG